MKKERETRYLFIYNAQSGLRWRKVEPQVYKKVEPQVAKTGIFEVETITSEITYHIKYPVGWLATDAENILRTQIHPTGTAGPKWL